mgnify:CR=1 FL=1
MNEAITYDDIQIVPSYSEILSRSDCVLTSKISKNVTLDIPIVSAPMNTITWLEMCIAMDDLGGMGILHRFSSVSDMKTALMDFRNLRPTGKIGASVGVTGDYLDRAKAILDSKADILLIDVAHGHHVLVKKAIEEIKSLVPDVSLSGKYNTDIMLGNIATAAAAKDCYLWGADSIRVGIGSGSLCTTRIKTGVGVPMVTCIQDIINSTIGNPVPIVADGGLKTPGDISKAIALGASCVMLGGILSGTQETPGESIRRGSWPHERLVKRYSGSASQESKLERGEDDKNVEGVTTEVLYKGKVKRIVNEILDGLRSSMSYIGASTITEFQNNAKFIKVTNNGRIEATPHGAM